MRSLRKKVRLVTSVPPPPHLRRNDSRGALNVVRPPLRPPLLRRIDSRSSLAPGSFQQPRPVRAPFIRPPFNGAPPRPPEPGIRHIPPGIRPSPRPYLAQSLSRDGVVTSVEGGIVGVETSSLQQQGYINTNEQKSLDPEHKQNILNFANTRIHSMERQNQAEDFDRPVSRTGGDAFSVNGHLIGGETQQKSPEPQKAQSAPAKVPPVASLEQKLPLSTQSVPPPFSTKVPPMFSSELNRSSSATYSVAGAQRPISSSSNVGAGEFHKLPSAAPSVISTDIRMSQSGPSSAISSENGRSLPAASSMISAELARVQPVVQKTESSKVMNGVAVKTASGIKNGHAVSAGKEDDDDSDVITMRSRAAMSSSSDKVVVGGATTGVTKDETQGSGKSVHLESQFAENLRFETKANTVAVAKGSPKIHELKEAHGKEDLLTKMGDKEGKFKEDKGASPGKELFKDKEMMIPTEILKDSLKKESNITVEKNETPASKQVENENSKKKESLNAGLDITSQLTGTDNKPSDRTDAEIYKNTEEVISDISLKSQKLVKVEIEKGDNQRGSVCSNNELRLKEERDVKPVNVEEFSKKGSVQEAKNLREKEVVGTVDTDVINKGSPQQKEESKYNKSGESYNNLIEDTKKGCAKEERKENEAKALESSPKRKEDETVKEWLKKEEGKEIKKLEDTSKKAVGEIEYSPKKKDENEKLKMENYLAKYSEDYKQEFPKDKPETVITKEEHSLKNEGEGIKRNKEETEVVKKAEFLKKETNNYVEQASTEKTEKHQPGEKKSENKYPSKNVTSTCVENETLRPGSVSPVVSKSTKSQKSKSGSEPTTARKTASTPGPATSSPKEPIAKVKPRPEEEKSSRPKTPKDLGDSKLKRVSVKKGERQSVDEIAKKKDGDHDSGVDESTQGNEPTTNGEIHKSPTKIPKKPAGGVTSPIKSPVKTSAKPKTPDTAASTAQQDKKKVPMNKVQVGSAPSPNLKTVRSKIGSLDNASYRPGGGKIKIENRKVDFSKTQPKIAAKNDAYVPGGGDKKIQQVKLAWNAKSKVGSLDNATHKPGGGEKKIESVKLDFKEKAKPKIGSKDNVKHQPGGGVVKIENQKVDFKAESKVGSLANVKHKPGGGDIKIFDDKLYLKQISGGASSIASSEEGHLSGTQSPVPHSPSQAISETGSHHEDS